MNRNDKAQTEQNLAVPERRGRGRPQLRSDDETRALIYEAARREFSERGFAAASIADVACRAGVCGCCKTKVVSGKYSVTSTMTLTDAEIADGYVLACSCHPQSDLVLA